MKARKRQIIKLSLMIGLTFTFFLAEVICGHITGSLALIGDSYHMISDVLALIIGLSCVVISSKSSTQNTFGWARAEILGALFNSIFLATLCFTILIEAVERLIHPHDIHEPDVLLVVGCLGLGVNLFGIVMFCNEAHGHGHSHAPPSSGSSSDDHNDTVVRQVANGHLAHSDSDPPTPEAANGNGSYAAMSSPSTEAEGKCGSECSDIRMDKEITKGLDCMELSPHLDPENRSKKPPVTEESSLTGNKNKKNYSAGQMNIRGVFLHILGDALGSIVVITSALIIKYCEGKWTFRVDPVLSLIMISIILSTTFPLLKQSSLILLQHAPQHILPSELIDRLSTQIPGLQGVHELHVWQLVSTRNVASMHIKCPDSDSYEEMAKKIRMLLHEEGIHSTTIQPEFIKEPLAIKSNECSMECRRDDSCSENRCCSASKDVRKRSAPDV